MAYMALYRKWRPSVFEDVKGQEHIVTTLKNQLMAQRIGHAYLFCGTRGTGKTTIAKLFAKAVNCEHPIEGSPCNECPTCQAINRHNSMNVIEIDAASNNGVDNIREIKEQVQYSPTEGKYKVYIIDEVHMLSMGAFNALLKTLEEPPSYVIFILATTEVHKIPVTILSRCQRYDFKRITVDTISNRLLDLMRKEKIEVEEKAIRYISKAADGSMRDALSLLDQCIAFYLGKKLTYDNVLEVLGAADITVFADLFFALQEKNVEHILTIIEDMIMSGREITQFVTDFLWYLRNLLLIKIKAEAQDILDMSTDTIEVLRQQAETVEVEELMRYVRIVSELSNDVKYAVQKRVVVEVGFIKLCTPQMEQDISSLLERIRRLEKIIEEGKIQIPKAEVLQRQEPEQIEEKISIEEAKKEFPEANWEEIQQIIANWSNIKKKLTFPMKKNLENARPVIGQEGNYLMLVFQEDGDGFMGKMYFDREHHRQELSDHIAKMTGRIVQIETLMEQGSSVVRDTDAIDFSRIKMPVEFIEE
ncbi:MAG: DNA polymerase III subunit gamma/tau [Lachnospiraceae bacterium]